MTDDFWNCPYTGGEKPCNPACLLFVREHTSIKGKKHANYCKTFGIVDKAATAQLVATLEGDLDG